MRVHIETLAACMVAAGAGVAVGTRLNRWIDRFMFGRAS